ncbi:MAG: hypothetical protein ABEJ02_01775 [Candidatus Paceibacteria bacterium]
MSGEDSWTDALETESDSIEEEDEYLLTRSGEEVDATGSGGMFPAGEESDSTDTTGDDDSDRWSIPSLPWGGDDDSRWSVPDFPWEGDDDDSTPTPGIPDPDDIDTPDFPKVPRRYVLVGIAGLLALDYSNVVDAPSEDKNAGSGYFRLGDCGGDIDGFGELGRQEECESPRDVAGLPFESYEDTIEGEVVDDVIQEYEAVQESEKVERETDADINKLGEKWEDEIGKNPENYRIGFVNLEDGGGVIQLLENETVVEYQRVDQESYNALRNEAQAVENRQR